MNGKLGVKPVAQINRSISSALPSVKMTRLPSSRSMPGLVTIRPWTM